MGPDDDTNGELNFPVLPPCTPEQARQAILNSQIGLGKSLMDQFPKSPMPGLASALSAEPLTFPQGPRSPGLASGLAGQGITSVSGCDPRLVDVTTDPKTPAYQTAQGTVIQMNKPAPDTTLPWGAGLDHLIQFADNTGLDSVKITGGSEANGHSTNPNDAHPLNHAIDVSADTPLDNEAIRQAALAAGYTHGIYEIEPGGIKHWHLQVGPDNIKNAEAYDLNNGPIRTKDHTQAEKQSNSDDEGR